jgi:hypothetical protein
MNMAFNQSAVWKLIEFKCEIDEHAVSSTNLSIYVSTALVDFGRFFSFLIHTQSVGLLRRGINPSQGRYVRTE